ncbi:MAG: hypothetical protein DCF26_09135 [Burkholderiales bacterium]|nr:MAG: hypothetical protein DCF26_09135 [Burkholderiales bacterium]
MLGLFLTLAENIRLLVVGPLLMGAVVYGLTYLLPQSFESSAVLLGDANTSAFITTAPVLEVSLKNLGYLKNASEQQAEEARADLEGNVKVRTARDSKLITLTVARSSPEAAQKMANEILNQTFAASKPKGAEQKRLESERAFLERQARELDTISKATQTRLQEATVAENLGNLAESLASISNASVKIHLDILALEKRILGVTAEDLLQTPTLPLKSVSPKRGLTALLASASAGLLLLIFVFLKQAFQNSIASEHHRERLEALKRRYSLGR